MPTPLGLLKSGDRIRHKASGVICRVVRREGNDAIYSVILHQETGEIPKHRGREFRMLEAPYHIKRDWELVPDALRLDRTVK